MGCCYEAAELQSLCDDVRANLLNTNKNDSSSSTTSSPIITLPRNFNTTIQVERAQQHQQKHTKSLKIYNEETIHKDCHQQKQEENETKKEKHKAVITTNKAITIHIRPFEPSTNYNIDKSSDIDSNSTTSISRNNSGSNRNNIYTKNNNNEQKESICLQFKKNSNNHLNKVLTTTATTEAIKARIRSSNNSKTFCEHCYSLACHNRIGCCTQPSPKQQIQQIQSTSNRVLHQGNFNLRPVQYSETNISGCHYCHCQSPLQQQLPYIGFYHQQQYRLQSKALKTKHHPCYKRKFHNESSRTEKTENFIQNHNNSALSLSSSFVGGYRKDDGYYCLLRTLSHACNNILTNAAINLKNSVVPINNNYLALADPLVMDSSGEIHTRYNLRCCPYQKPNLHCATTAQYRTCRRQQQEEKHQLNSHNKPFPSHNIRSTQKCRIIKENNSDDIRYMKNCSKWNYNSTNAAYATVTSPTVCKATFITAAFNYVGHNYYYMLRNSINLYAASSVILVLCYLTTVASAAATKLETSSIDRHPVALIDWSKFDESSSDKEILDLLLEKKRYDKRLLPPVNDEDFCCGMSSPEMVIKENARRPHHRGTLTVNVNVLLLSLASPDESSLKYEVEFLLNQQWNDPRLEYGNKSHYDFLNALHHHESIWTPDTYFIMHGDFKDPIIPMHFALRIYRNGTITYAMRRHLILSCQGSLHIFPFDDPKCSFSMESISYEESQIKYVWKNDEDTLRKSPSLTTLNAYLIRNKTTPCDQNSWRGNYSCLRVDLIFTRDRAFYFTTVFIPGIILVTSSFITFWLEWNAVPARSMIGNYSCLQVELTFTRDRAYYFTTVFIPGIILVTSSFITFWLEWNAVPARVMIGVTTMLNFFTTSNGFRSTLPVVSNLTAMNVWDGVCMCFIYASLLEFVCVNYMGRKRPQHNVVYRPGENPVTQRLPAVLSRIGVILASPLVVIEREFHAALHSQREAASVAASAVTATSTSQPTQHRSRTLFHQESTSGIISSAVQNLRTRNFKSKTKESCHLEERQSRKDRTYEHTYCEPEVNVLVIESESEAEKPSERGQLKRLHSMSTNTPPLIYKGELKVAENVELAERQMIPKKPPRKKASRSTSPSINYDTLQGGSVSGPTSLTFQQQSAHDTGEKKRDTSGPNEIVACTTCGGSSSSPCTHSANNGCATETCFVQVRKKEPPHPIRIAKTIDVIARITFPTAYAIFLIFFFVHYKGFS